MKNGIVVVATVVVLAAAVVIADNFFSKHSKPAPVRAQGPDAPKVAFKDLEGKDVSLDQYKGKVVLVNFWATWCAPCRIEIPWFIEFQRKYGARGFTVLGVAMDDEGKSVVEPYVRDENFELEGKQLAINYPILLGNDDVAQKFGGLIGIPTSVLISRDGKIVKRFIGLVNHDNLVKEIEALL